MKISRNWLQKYFEKPLPNAEDIADALTFHAFEIEEQQGDSMDVKVLPNRAADCLCHRGIAKELSAILDVPMKKDPLREVLPEFPRTSALSVEVEDSQKCQRYMGALVRGVKIGPSPDWLCEALESVGQRSINNVVDATNYVMLNIGQPLHAFDAANLAQKDGTYKITVRVTDKVSETVDLLSVGEIIPQEGTLLITDGNSSKPLAIAGIKGGSQAGVTENTTDLIVESANFDGTMIRRTAQALKLITDASLRFQNRPSPELCAYGMRDVLSLITEIAGGEVEGVTDAYPACQERSREVSVSLSRINGVLGSDFSKEEVENVFKRLDLDTKTNGETFIVTPPFERIDLTPPAGGPEDLAEEAGRVLGYDQVPATELPPVSNEPNHARYRGIEKVKDFLVEKGFTEISTQSFAKDGEVMLANPLDKNMPALRASLDENMKKALAQAVYSAPLVFTPNEKPKLFEIGTIFTKDSEKLEVKTSEPISDLPAIQDDKNYIPQQYQLGSYQQFSVYPFITRDIALWVPSGTNASDVGKLIQNTAGELLVRTPYKFDEFSKDGKTSFAFSLIFQSFDRTLTDEEINVVIAGISEALKGEGYEVR